MPNEQIKKVHLNTPNSNKAGLLFCAPWIAAVVLLFAWPFAASLYWSFCSFDIINPAKFVGFENYRRIAEEIAAGRGAGRALMNTMYYSLLSVPLSIAMGVSLAVLLSVKVRGQAFFRTIIFLPSIIPIVASSILWVWMLDPDTGLINTLIGYVGIPPQNWLNQSRSAVSIDGLGQIGNWFSGGRMLLFGSKDALVLMTMWGVGNFVVIYLAAIGDIPKSLYEAASIDGASGPEETDQHHAADVITGDLFQPVDGDDSKHPEFHQHLHHERRNGAAG